MPRKSHRPKVMTVCLANRARSPTAEWLLQRHYKVKSCGTAEFDATKPCDKYDMLWANDVLVMEPYQKRNLEQRFPAETENGSKITVLDVPEVGKYSCQPSLLTEIAGRLKDNGYRVRDISNLAEASNACIAWTSNNADRKLRSQMQKARPLPDYWAPYVPFEEGVVTKVTQPLEPWQVEEREAFERAAGLSTGQGGISRILRLIGGEPVPQPTEPQVVEDSAGLRVFVGDRELEPEDIDKWVETGKLPKEKRQKKMVSELKKYADSVKKFFKE